MQLNFTSIKEPAIAALLAGLIVSGIHAAWDGNGWGFVRPKDTIATIGSQVGGLEFSVDSLRQRTTRVETKVDMILKSQCLSMSVGDAIRIGLPCDVLVPGWPGVISR